MLTLISCRKSLLGVLEVLARISFHMVGKAFMTTNRFFVLMTRGPALTNGGIPSNEAGSVGVLRHA